MTFKKEDRGQDKSAGQGQGAGEVRDDVRQPRSDSNRDRDNREDREDRREERRSDREERPVSTLSGRNNRFRAQGEAGRSDLLHKTYVEIMKDEGESLSRLIKPMGEAMRPLSRKHGWLVYLTNVEQDVLMHVLLLEGNKEPVRREAFRDRSRDDRDRDSRGRREDVFVYTSTIDDVTEEIIDVLRKFVTTNVKFSGKLIYSGITVIPAEVVVDDEAAITPYILSADEANWSAAGCDVAFTADYLNEDSTLRGSLNFQPGHIDIGFSGQPIRADISGVIREHVDGKSKNQLMANEVGQVFSTFNAYINARYHGTEDHDRRGRRDREGEFRHFVPECIVTEINTFCDAEVGSLERLLLTIGNLPFINTGDRWMQQYEGVFDKDGSTDLGALGYAFDPKVTTPDRIADAEQYTADSRKLPDFLDRLMYLDDGIEYAYRLQEGCPGWTISRILVDAYENIREAQQLVDQALDNLTDNAWSDATAKWSDKERCLVADVIRVPVGHWVERGGERVPSEKIDTIAVCARAKTNHVELIDDWIEVNQLGSNNRYDFDQRITKYVDVLSSVSQKTFIMKGYATQMYFNPEALELIHQLLKESAFALDLDYDGGSEFGRSRRASGARFAVANNLAGRSRRPYNSGRREDDRSARVNYRR